MSNKKIIVLAVIVGGIVISGANAQIGEEPAGPTVEVDEIYVELETYRLYAFSNGEYIESYPISTGYDTAPTPTGEFEIINQLKHPWYTPSDEPAVAPGDEDNPIGTRWLGINKPSYGIHGTTEPDKIRQPASDGCVRMLNEHVEELYEKVGVGTRVVIEETFERETITQLAEYRGEDERDDSEEEEHH